MAFFSFGEYQEGKGYKVVDERVWRGSAGVMLLLGFIAFVNGFILKNYIVLPYISGFLVANFAIGIFINPKFSPTVFVARLLTSGQSKLPIGAVQKRFAWSLGLSLSIAIFVLSLQLLSDVSYFDPVCMLCLICLLFLYLESAFGICVGCKLYTLALKTKLMKAPEERPNCMGDSCEV
jgi:uncharacterized RDD family membrane protein YckC